MHMYIDIDSIDKLWISISWPCRWECDNAIDNKVYNHQIHCHAQCTARDGSGAPVGAQETVDLY